MVTTKFNDSFYKEVRIAFDNSPNKIKKLFVEAFEAKIIKEDFPPYLHTLISAACMIKDKWEDIIMSAKKNILGDGTFTGEEHVLDKLVLGMLFLYADKANLIDKDRVKIAKEYSELEQIIEDPEEKECCMGAETEYSVTDEPVKSWDEYFYNVARQAARNSKCFSRRIGAVLVKDNIIISTGYNGPPRGIPTCDKIWKIDTGFIAKYGGLIQKDTETVGKCPRYVLGAKSGEQMELCPAGHAEENSILNCARLGISTMDTTMYMTCGIPCGKCMIKIINAGVKELVVTTFTYYDDNAKYLLENSNIRVRLFDFLI